MHTSFEALSYLDTGLCLDIGVANFPDQSSFGD